MTIVPFTALGRGCAGVSAEVLHADTDAKLCCFSIVHRSRVVRDGSGATRHNFECMILIPLVDWSWPAFGQLGRAAPSFTVVSLGPKHPPAQSVPSANHEVPIKKCQS